MGRNLRMSFPSGLAELDLRTNTTVSWHWLMVLRWSKIESLAALELCEMIASCGGGCFMDIKWWVKCAEVQGINTWMPPVHDDCLTVGLDDWWFLSLKTQDALHVEVYFWFPLWPEASWLSVKLGCAVPNDEDLRAVTSFFALSIHDWDKLICYVDAFRSFNHISFLHMFSPLPRGGRLPSWV